MNDIQEEITSIATIVSNLHAFSDQKQSANEEIDVNHLIRNILNLIQFHARDQQIEIHFEPCEADLSIQANKNEIKQVLLNLFKNSFEVMPAGGEIFIRTLLVNANGVPWRRFSSKTPVQAFPTRTLTTSSYLFTPPKRGRSTTSVWGFLSATVLSRNITVLSLSKTSPALAAVLLLRCPNPPDRKYRQYRSRAASQVDRENGAIHASKRKRSSCLLISRQRSFAWFPACTGAPRVSSGLLAFGRIILRY